MVSQATSPDPEPRHRIPAAPPPPLVTYSSDIIAFILFVFIEESTTKKANFPTA